MGDFRPVKNRGGIIYLTRCLVNGKIYVGLHTGGDDGYLGSGTALLKAIKKYGKENYERVVLDTFSLPEEGFSKEIFWIKEKNSKKPNGYNLTDGGDGLLNPSCDTRLKISISQMGNKHCLGRVHTKETKDKIGMANKNKPRSTELRAVLSKALLGKPWSEARRRAGNPKLTEETKRKIGAKQKGHPHSLETRERISVALRGRPWSDARRVAWTQANE